MTSTNELRDYYDATDQSAALAAAEHESGGDVGAGEVLVSTSIRLPKSLMDQVRVRADHAGVPATTLMRQWITARINEADPDARVVSVADLEQLIAARGHSAAGSAP